MSQKLLGSLWPAWEGTKICQHSHIKNTCPLAYNSQQTSNWLMESPWDINCIAHFVNGNCRLSTCVAHGVTLIIHVEKCWAEEEKGACLSFPHISVNCGSLRGSGFKAGKDRGNTRMNTSVNWNPRLGHIPNYPCRQNWILGLMF